jgi:DNA-binding transcriptional regulator LsrR (DeoR family)
VNRKEPDLSNGGTESKLRADHGTLFMVLQRFLAGATTEEIQKELALRGYRRTRQAIYSLVREGVRLGWVALKPPRYLEIENRLRQRFGGAERRFTVVNYRGEAKAVADQVAAKAASVLMDIIDDQYGKQSILSIGLGAGNTTRRVAREFARLLRARDAGPRLRLHALSPGYYTDPRTSPNAYFGLFDESESVTECFGFFAPGFASGDVLQALRSDPGVSAAFAVRDEIRILVSSVGAWNCEHSALRRLGSVSANPLARATQQALDGAGVVGDFHYLPYNQCSPVLLPDGLFQPSTIFKLSEIVDRVHRDQMTALVVVAPCPGCATSGGSGSIKAAALLPLLTEPQLDVCRRVVMDIASAEELLATRGSLG